MQILNDIIATLDTAAPLRDIRQGVFHTAVVTRRCGLAATLPRDALRQTPPLVREPGRLLERSAADLVRLAFSERILEAAMGMAAINSLLSVDDAACIEVNAAELILEKGAGRNVAIVGHFPFIERVRQTAAALWVIEKNPRAGDVTADQAAHLIPAADLVAITGTALTNHTLSDLLALCRPAAFVIMLGDTVPLTPVLFDNGVDALCGTLVVDDEQVLRCVSQGANFRQIGGTRRVALLR